MTQHKKSLPEAIRALELPEPAGTLQYVRPLGRPGYLKAYTADQVRTIITAIATLVEEQEKWYAVDFAEVPMPGHWVASWPVKQQQGYVDGYRACQKKEQERQEPEFCGRPGTGECSCRKFMDDPTNCERRLEEVATLAATQAGDAAAGCIVRDAENLPLCVGTCTKRGQCIEKQTLLSRLDELRVILQMGTVTIDKIHELGADGPAEEAWLLFHDEIMPIIAAMSPTTTRSE